MAVVKIKKLDYIGNIKINLGCYLHSEIIFYLNNYVDEILCLFLSLKLSVFFFCLYRYKFSVLALTYVAYTCYHLTRKPISVVKAVLHRNCSLVEIPQQIRLVKDVTNESTWCDYAPFGE